MNTSKLYAAMGDPNQGSSSSSSRRRRSREIETLSLEIRKYPRDLFHNFPPTDPNSNQQPQKPESDLQIGDGDLELNLGLSLGGRFGVDRSHRGLIRSSSIAGSLPSMEEASPAPAPALARTASLPSETEEEWRRRKEIQTLRRLEARRRRSEKQKSVRESGNTEENSNPGSGRRGNPGHGLPGCRVGSSRRVGIGGVVGKGGFFGSLQGLLTQQMNQNQNLNQNPPEICSQGSGGSSSGVSELENKAQQGSGSGSESKSPASIHSTQDGRVQDAPAGPSSGPITHPDPKKTEQSSTGMEEMPSVFTIGDGPSGRKVDGILYRYGRGEEARIMCICHGSFFSPADFVKHAGGHDTDHPLRHIVVNPSPSALQ